MKRKHFFSLFVLIGLLTLGTLASCQDDENIELKGQLYLHFENQSSIAIDIYTLADKQNPIYETVTGQDGTLQLTLNMGDYLLQPENLRGMAFQIRPGETTSITYDENNVPVRE